MMDKVIVGVVSAGLGFLSGLLAPWIRWSIEKRRGLRKKRGSLVKRLKILVSADDFQDSTFLQSKEYSELRVHLSEDVVRDLEANTRAVVQNTGRRRTLQEELLDAIAQLEKDWKLI